MTVKIRKKPVTVEAIQWTGGNPNEVREFCKGPDGSNFDQFDLHSRETYQVENPEMTAVVYDRLHDRWVPLRSGDWVIRGVKGEFYPCEQQVMQETYDRVEES